MRDKKRFYLKNSIIAMLIALGIALVSVFFFALTATRDMEKYDHAMSALEETSYDYRLYSPTQSQVEELEGLESVEAVFPYYCYDAVISYQQKAYDTNAIFADDASNLWLSEYNEKRLLSGSMELDENYILLDKVCADTLGVKCGDSVTIKLNKTPEISVVVVGIFKDNTFFKEGSVYLDYSGVVKEEIDGNYKELKPSGVLLKERNASCWNDIKSYVPLGKMLPEDYFSSDREYEEYVKNFVLEDYSSEIYNKKELLKSEGSLNQRYVERADRSIMYGSIFYGIAFLLLFLQAIGAKKFVESFAKNNNSQIATNELTGKYIKKDILSAVTGAVVFILIFVFTAQDSYVSNEFKGKVIWYFMSAALISLIILLVIDIAIILKSIHKGIKYTSINDKTPFERKSQIIGKEQNLSSKRKIGADDQKNL